MRCEATIDQKVRCEQAAGHAGRHSSGLLVWHEPPLILVDGREPDLTAETEHWKEGRVVFSWERA